MTSRLLLVGVLAATLASCSPAAPDGPSVPTLELTAVQRFGTVDGVGSTLSAVEDVAVLEGAVLILESLPARVAVFAEDGRWLHDIGREGDGPGELRRPRRLSLHDGRIVVADPRGGRLEAFLPDGRHTASLRWDIQPDGSVVRAFPLRYFRDGSVFAGPGDVSIGGVLRGDLSHQAYYRADESGRIEAELFAAPFEPSDAWEAELEGGRAMIGIHPHRITPLVEALPDGAGLVVVERPLAERPDSASFDVTVVRPDGTVAQAWSVPYAPTDGQGWRDAFIEEAERQMTEMGGEADRAVLAAVRDALPDRAYYPPVSDLVVGSDGTLWLRREERPASAQRWEAWRLDGTPVARLDVPDSWEVVHATAGELWTVVRDELDVPYVVRHRIEGWPDAG